MKNETLEGKINWRLLVEGIIFQTFGWVVVVIVIDGPKSPIKEVIAEVSPLVEFTVIMFPLVKTVVDPDP